MKRCTRCKVNLPISSFCRNKAEKDGFSHRCKACHTLDNREWRERHPEARRAAQRRKYALHKPVSRKTPAQRSAHNAVGRATKTGRLQRPAICPSCGKSDSPIQAHHDAYNDKLRVQWRCARCHGRLHVALRASA